ncbi:MAG TPA: hypothetical protein VF773_02160 [Verrucomicrobiae bacterium]
MISISPNTILTNEVLPVTYLLHSIAPVLRLEHDKAMRLERTFDDFPDRGLVVDH